jgi:succinate dehydrogenase / fumarate reductase membrane anchor subunit
MTPDKSGTTHFRQMGWTSMASVPLVLFLLWFIISHLGAARADVVASVQNPINAILLALSFVPILWHMGLGMQMVLEDYVHEEKLLRAGIFVNQVFTVVVGVAALYAIFEMFIGA